MVLGLWLKLNSQLTTNGKVPTLENALSNTLLFTLPPFQVPIAAMKRPVPRHGLLANMSRIRTQMDSRFNMLTRFQP